jgi:hypothetical protein
MKMNAEDVEESGVLSVLLSVSGASSITLISPGCTMTLSDEMDLETLPAVRMFKDGGCVITEPSRVIAEGNTFPVLGPSIQRHVLSLCLRRVQPKTLSFLILRREVPNLRELFFPEGMTVVSDSLCNNLRRLERVVFPGPAVLTKIGAFAFSGCCSLRSLTLPARVKLIRCRAFDGAGIERMSLLDMEIEEAYLNDMTRVKFLAFGPSIPNISFIGAASLRYLTFGRISMKGECGGHPIEARFLTVKGRFPRNRESVLRESHLFAELGGAEKRVSSPMTPP